MKQYIIITLICSFCNLLKTEAQVFPKEKRIYLVDVTASMKGKGIVETPDIFEKVKNELTSAVKSVYTKDTDITIIPFTSVPHKTIIGNSNKKDSLIAEIDKLSIMKGDTNIADAWNAGLREIDSTRINYIFLLTDGLHNCGPKSSILYERLRDWHNIATGKYYFAFYVMLTANAKEQEICKIINETEQMWLIESTNVNATFILSYINVQANIKEHKQNIRLDLNISNPNVTKEELSFNLELENNPFYKITNVRPQLDKNCVLFDIVELKPLMELPLEIWLKVRFTYNKEKHYLTFFTPETFNFKIINRGIRKMIITE